MVYFIYSGFLLGNVLFTIIHSKMLPFVLLLYHRAMTTSYVFFCQSYILEYRFQIFFETLFDRIFTDFPKAFYPKNVIKTTGHVRIEYIQLYECFVTVLLFFYISFISTLHSHIKL